MHIWTISQNYAFGKGWGLGANGASNIEGVLSRETRKPPKRKSLKRRFVLPRNPIHIACNIKS